MNIFELAYSRLNSAQKQAVDTIFGPVAVIAGPGTGKTQLLTLRIANILLKTDVSPRNILALTYTEAGAFAMRDRLKSFIGSDALRVNIQTFHSFCKELIDDEYPEKFIRSRDMKMLEELDSRRMVAQILLESDLRHLKPRHDPELYMGDVIRIVGTLKREGVSPRLFRDKVDEAITNLPNNPELHYQKNSQYGKKGDPKPAFREEKERLERQRELSFVYESYEKQLIENSRYDYDDMLLLVRNQLKNDAEFLSSIREEYQFIMVDEFQDSNSLQASIVDLIMSGLEQPNILVVGDDEQSIYRFQGAVMENMLAFCEQYKIGLTLINLTENYRSSQTILDASRAVIRHNTESLEKVLHLNKQLSKQAKVSEQMIEFINVPDPQIEIASITERIKELHASGISWSDIAIIYRKNANPIHLIAYLRREKIPFHKQKGENLLHHPEAKKLLKVLRLIDNINQNDLFWEVMLFDFWKLDLHHLLHIQNKSKAPNSEIRGRLWEAFILDPDPWVRDITQKLVDFHALAANKTLVQFFEDFLETSGYRKFSIEQEDAIERLSILNSFFDEVKSFAFLYNNAGLSEFIEYMADLEHYGLSPTTQPIRLVTDAVELMTAHGSKGLEYRAVIIYDATSKNWEALREPAKLTISVSLFEGHLIDKHMKKNLKLEEERRLWYVAMTRAKEYCIISSTSNEDLGLVASFFVNEIPEQFIKTSIVKVSPEKIILSQTAPVPAVNWTEATKSELQERAKNYDLSVTALNTWIESPLEFLHKYLIRQPAGKMPSASFGTAVHAGLAFIGKYFNEHGNIPEEIFWAEEVERVLYKEILTSREQKEFLTKIKSVITSYLAKTDCPLASRALIEERFGYRKVVVEGVRLTGVFDRVEYCLDGSMQVVDFKTGKADKTKQQLANYERQLYFYRLLWDGSNQSKILSRGILDFAEDAPGETVNRVHFAYETSQISLLKSYIAAFKISLESLNFPEKNIFIT